MKQQPQLASAGLDAADGANERLVIWPHRSLGWRGACALVGVIAVVFGAIAIRALLAGAWPTVVYTALALGGFAGSLACNYRNARLAQVIEFGPDVVRVSHHDARGGEKPPIEFNPRWLRIVEAPGPWAETRLLLRQSGRSIAIGDFLSVDERKALAAELRDLIARRYAATP